MKRLPDPRDLRLQDYKSSWALAAEDCFTAHERAAEALRAMMEAERSMSLHVDASTQELLAQHARLSVLHQKVDGEMRASIEAMCKAADSIRNFDAKLNGQDGVAAKTAEMLLGPKGVVAGLASQAQAMIARMEHRLQLKTMELDDRLNGGKGVAAQLGDKLLGREGLATRFQRQLKGSVDHAAEAMDQLAGAALQVKTVLDGVKFTVLMLLVTFSVGTTFGAALPLLLKRLG